MSSKARRILLVEDEPTLQRILGSVLTDAGHAVESVGTAEAAMQRLEDVGREPIELVLSDKNLPGKSGLDLLEQARAQEQEKGFDRAFVLVTGYPSRESAMSLVQHNGNGYLVKPFRSLIHAVERITAILDAPLAAHREASDAAHAAVATLLDDAAPAFSAEDRIAILLDDEKHRATFTARIEARGGVVVEVDALSQRDAKGRNILIAGRVEDLAEYALKEPRTALVLADGGPSFKVLTALIQGGGGAVIDPALVPGPA